MLLFFLAALQGMQDLSSLTRDPTVPPAVGARSLNHWTAREVPQLKHCYLNLLLPAKYCREEQDSVFALGQGLQGTGFQAEVILCLMHEHHKGNR